MTSPKESERPFYWTREAHATADPSGWYQWTDGNLKYLGATVRDWYQKLFGEDIDA